MLSIEVCRKILGVDESEVTKEELENIRYSLYQISQVIVNQYLEGKTQCTQRMQ